MTWRQLDKMAAARQRYDREFVLTQADVIWTSEEFDRLQWIETGSIQKPKKANPRDIPGVAEKIAEIMANGGRCIVAPPSKVD